jgi:DNA invertase Pin-like site-specific DNA recombinase
VGWGERRGFEVVKPYEFQESAFTKGKVKAAMDRAIEDGRRGEFTVLMIWALDRLTRQGGVDTLQTLQSFARSA